MKHYRPLLFSQITLQIIGIFVTLTMTTFYFHQEFEKEMEHSLIQKLQMLSSFISDKCPSLLYRSDLRITLIQPDGTVLCDTFSPSVTSNHKLRPEVAQALKNRTIPHIVKRKSATFKEDFLYGAILLPPPHHNILRLAIPLRSIQFNFLTLSTPILLFIIPTMVLLILVGLRVGIRQNQQAEKEVSKLKEDLVANISHEVRTPLTSLKGYVQLLKQITQGDDKIRPYLSKIENNSERLSLLFRDVLDLTVLENQEELTIEVVDTEDLTNRVVQSVINNYPDKKIDVQTSFMVKRFDGNNHIVEQIVTNIIDNAFKYTPIHQSGSTLKISWKREGSWFLLSVQDDGIGIPEQDIPRIFERFYRVDSSRSREMGGTGLGLAIVKHGVQKHRGKIEVKSQIGKGSEFIIKFPIRNG